LRSSRRKRLSRGLTWILWLSLAATATNCTRKAAPNPQTLYADAWSKVKRGDLIGASADVDAFGASKSAASVEWASRFRVLKAEILRRQGKFTDAVALLEAPLPEQFAKSDIAVWRKITQGTSEAFLGQYDLAEKSLTEAEALAKQNQPDLLGEVAIKKGTLAWLRGDTDTARSEYLASLSIARSIHDSYLEANSLTNLGNVATRQEHFDESIDWNRTALQVMQSTNAPGAQANILGNMGWSYLDLGDYENALALFQQADAASGKAGSLGAQIQWRLSIGNIHLARRDYGSAERAYQGALDVAKSLHDEDSIAQCLENLALVSLETGQVDAAQHYNEQVASSVHAHSDQILSVVIHGRIQELGHKHKEARKAFESVIHDSNAPTPLRWEAQSHLAEVYASEGNRAEAERQFRSALATITTARASIKTEELRLSFLSNAITFYDDYIDFLISQGRPGDALQVAEVSRAQTLAEGLGLGSKILFPIPNFQPRAIAQRFGATLLFYWLGEKHSYLWAITSSSVSLFTLPPSSEIESALKSYREALLGPRDVLEASSAQGSKLYDILVAPAQKLIASGSRVLILPDAGLYGLNFETLLDPKPKLHYWVEDAVVAYANSLVLLAASANQPVARTKKLLLVGNPISPSAEFPDLPQAGTEMTDVERYFAAPDRTVLSRQRATASAYLESKPAQYSFIHFVAHGTASRASPLDSAVILSKQGDSYKLYARDIVTQPLHANLVTISACHGAGERTYSGEGLVGLTWAFLRAGAHGVIAALWEVNDNSTPELMDDLYAEIQKGSAPDAALHHAKLKLLNSGTVYQKPFYWAPFEIYLGH
jgi:CHAT domain-containing protein